MKAMILAAGRGARMRPLTDAVPKPLIEVRGKPLIEWHLEKLARAGFTEIVINVSHLAELIMHHVGDGSKWGVWVKYSLEPDALESGGGVATAAPLLGNGAFALVSSDIFWSLDYAHLAACCRALPINRAHWWFVRPRPGAPGREFSLREDGLVVPPNEADALTLANVTVMHSSLLQAMPRGEKFRLLPYYQQWVASGWVTGSLHLDEWENVTDVSDLRRLNATQI